MRKILSPTIAINALCNIKLSYKRSSLVSNSIKILKKESPIFKRSANEEIEGKSRLRVLSRTIERFLSITIRIRRRDEINYEKRRFLLLGTRKRRNWKFQGTRRTKPRSYRRKESMLKVQEIPARCYGARFLIAARRSPSPARAARQIPKIGSESFTPTVHTPDSATHH